jgi:hypothetical protein
MKVSERNMKRGKIGLTLSLTMGIFAVLFVTCAPSTFAQPTADNVCVVDNSGAQGTYVVVPVTITNVQDGPIICIVFDIHYTNSIIEVVGLQNGDLTSSWDSQYNPFSWGSRVSLVYDGQTEHGLQDGSTGSIVLLNLSVSGEPGETSMMNLANLQISDTVYNVGTAPTNNGTFSIPGSELTPTPTPTPSPTEPPPAGGAGGGKAAPPDSDGDGYPDQQEWFEGTDPNDPDDYPGKTVATPTPKPTIIPFVTSPVSPAVTLSPTPLPESPSQTPALKQPSFEATVAIVGLVAVAYVLRGRKKLL